MSKVKTIEVDHKEVKSISEDQLKGLQETVNAATSTNANWWNKSEEVVFLHQLAGAKNELTEYQKELTEAYGDVQIDLKDGAISPADAGNKED